MTTIGMNYEILEGKDQSFEKKFAVVLDVMSKTAGHISTHLYRDVFKERSYLVLSEWETRSTFDDFIGSDAFRKVTDWGTANILATRPKHFVYGDESGSPISTGGPRPAPAVQ